MTSREPSEIFNQERAASHDQRFARLAPLREALLLLIRAVFAELPAEAHVLCVGAGTGSELLHLAPHFPRWRFTAVEPASAMWDVCRRRAAESGVASRCVFHEGYLDTLPATDPFDAATALLVSQFCVRPEDRRGFFRQIAARLRPGGLLVSADLSADLSSPTGQSLLELWRRMFVEAGLPAEEIERYRASYGREVSVVSTEDVAALIAASGFTAPVLFLQTLLIHAWYTRRAA